MKFEDLKKQTFKDIFACNNKEAHSMKKTLNYSNYTKLDHDIITKKKRIQVFRDY
jgi:hypothetical protein